MERNVTNRQGRSPKGIRIKEKARELNHPHNELETRGFVPRWRLFLRRGLGKEGRISHIKAQRP